MISFRKTYLGHSDIAPGRKIDPGEAFDWAALNKAGFGLWLDGVKTEDVAPLAEGTKDKAVAPLQKALAAFGYQILADGSYGPKTKAVISAFQRHFRARQNRRRRRRRNADIGLCLLRGRFRETSLHWRPRPYRPFKQAGA